MAASKKTPKVDRSMSETPAPERKKALIRALRQAKATKASAGRAVKDLAAKLGYTPFDVYGLINGTSGKAGSNPACLRATGHVKMIELADQGMVVFLTSKGQTTDFTDRPFEGNHKPAAKKVAKATKKAAKPKAKAAPQPKTEEEQTAAAA